MFVIEGLLAIGAGSVFTFFWLDDTPQQARFLSLEEKNALIRQLASEEEKERSRQGLRMRCVMDASGNWLLFI